MSKGLSRALSLVKNEFVISRRHKKSAHQIRQATNGKSGLLLHLGCGSNLKPNWINIDLFAAKADAHLDLRESWPFADASAKRVYSEHVFEHFEMPGEVKHFLSEMLRVLEPGGTADIGVPDTERPLHAYGKAADEYWHISRSEWHPESCETQLDHINFHFRQDGEHKYAWDEETLTNELRKAGFASISRRPFDPSLDLESRRLGTLYVRARKPEAR